MAVNRPLITATADVSMSTLDVLATAASEAPLESALHQHTPDVLRAAATQELIQVVHRRHGVVGAHWAIAHATAQQQRDDLYVQLLPAGRQQFEA